MNRAFIEVSRARQYLFIITSLSEDIAFAGFELSRETRDLALPS